MAKEELKSPQRRTLTKRLIREAMLSLLRTNSIQKISVRALCDMAGIHRTTFYHHYNDTYEVLAEIEQEFLAQLSMEETHIRNTAELEHHIESLCLRLQQSQEAAVILLENNADPYFFDKLLAVQDHGMIWKQLNNTYSPDECALLRDFLNNGAYAVMLSWLKNGCQQSPKQVAGLLAKTIQQGVVLK